MYCRECGTKLDDNQKFCHNCGAEQGVNSSIKNQTISEENKSTDINSSSNGNYTIDPKMYIGACIGLLGTILLCVLPFMKSGYIELNFFDFLDLCSSKDKYLFVFFMSIIALATGIIGISNIIKIIIIPKQYLTLLQSGKEYKANKLFNKYTKSYYKEYLTTCLIPAVWLFSFAVTDSDDITDLSTGFWLCSLCMVVEGILFFISEPPTEQYITRYASNYETTGNTWICPECNSNNSINSNQCSNCGCENLPQSEQMWTCISCGQLNDADTSACSNCGRFRG